MSEQQVEVERLLQYAREFEAVAVALRFYAAWLGGSGKGASDED